MRWTPHPAPTHPSTPSSSCRSPTPSQPQNPDQPPPPTFFSCPWSPAPAVLCSPPPSPLPPPPARPPAWELPWEPLPSRQPLPAPRGARGSEGSSLGTHPPPAAPHVVSGTDTRPAGWESSPRPTASEGRGGSELGSPALPITNQDTEAGDQPGLL